jgi:hypothetical protein
MPTLNRGQTARAVAGVTLALATLAGCAGGGATVFDTPPNEVALTAASAKGTVALSGAVLDAAERTVTTGTGNLNRDTNAVTFSGLSGQINAARAVIDITGGGQATLTTKSGQFGARFTASPISGASTTGVIGVATLASDMPTGSADYTGDTRLSAQVGTDLYELTGTATVAATFGTSGTDGTVNTTLTGLSGQKIPSLADASAISDAGTLTLTGASITETSFTGGTAAATGDVIALSGKQTTIHAGQFFGPNATEAGGAFVIDDTSDGNTVIRGDFLVD